MLKIKPFRAVFICGDCQNKMIWWCGPGEVVSLVIWQFHDLQQDCQGRSTTFAESILCCSSGSSSEKRPCTRDLQSHCWGVAFAWRHYTVPWFPCLMGLLLLSTSLRYTFSYSVNVCGVAWMYHAEWGRYGSTHRRKENWSFTHTLQDMFSICCCLSNCPPDRSS